MPAPDELKAFFFEAMLAGYASDAQPTTSSTNPDWKQLSYRKASGALLLVDTWRRPDTVNAKGIAYSMGYTTIYHDKRPVWGMQYQGGYTDEAVSFLKLTLKRAYDAGEFWGGRGLPGMDPFGGQSYAYANAWKGGFTDFHGKECIINRGRECGSHRYHGGLLL